MYVFASWPGQAELVRRLGLLHLRPVALPLHLARRPRVPGARHGGAEVADRPERQRADGRPGRHHALVGRRASRSRGTARGGSRPSPIRTATTIAYGYDGNGDLVSVTDRESNTTRFGYHLEFPHHLDSIEDPLGPPTHPQRIRRRRPPGPPHGRLRQDDHVHAPRSAARQEIVTDRDRQAARAGLRRARQRRCRRRTRRARSSCARTTRGTTG